jgi:L-ascorbate metabolism protein UlaG (beta-lactamase superfamily)
MSFTLTWLGHGAFNLDIDQHQVLVDPFLTDNPAATAKAGEIGADFILISHGHGDHVGDAVAIAKRTGAIVISNFEIASWFEGQGVTAHAQHIGGGHIHPFGHLKLTLALHGSALPDGSDGGNPVGFLLTTPEGKKTYLACDTGLFSDMKLIGEEGVDLAVLPIGDNFTMGPGDALRAVKLIKPEQVIPVHYNTWDLIAQDGKGWCQKVTDETKTKALPLKPGESISL